MKSKEEMLKMSFNKHIAKILPSLSFEEAKGNNGYDWIYAAMEDYSNEQKKPLITFLESIANQLDKWAYESRKGGWSTHQVEPQIKLANEIRRLVSTQKTNKPNDTI